MMSVGLTDESLEVPSVTDFVTQEERTNDVGIRP